MAQRIHTFTTPLRDTAGAVYVVEVWGSQQEDGLWKGWLEFVRTDGRAVLRTGRETTQSHVGALTYWATGLELIYLEGAFARAVRFERRDDAVA